MLRLKDLTIDHQSGTVALRTLLLHRRCPWNEVRELIGRLLASDFVESIDVDRGQGVATVSLRTTDTTDPGSFDRSRTLRTIADGLRHPSASQHLLNVAYCQLDSFQIRKQSTGITGGSITSQVSGRVRLQHPLMRGHAGLARRVEFELSALQGVVSVTTSTWTGSVLINFKPGTLTPNQLLAAFERSVVGEGEFTGKVLAGPPISHWIAAGACLGLAVTSEFFVPGAAAVTAVALVGSNLPTLGRGVVELCTFKWRVASLYTVIMGTTLVSGQFLAAALMQTTITAWHAWTTHRLRKSVREIEASPEVVGGLIEAEPSLSAQRNIVPGAVVRVPVGAVLSFDGVIVRGAGDVDERGMRGEKSAVHCRSGDTVFAGSALLNGGLEVQVNSVGDKTRLSAVRRTVYSLICDAVGEGGATPHGKNVASRFVPLTFATGTAALLAGDITTLAAVLRPDFCTGPSLNDRLGTLTGVSHLLHDGWLVKKCETLHALANSRTIVLAVPTEHFTSKPTPVSEATIGVKQFNAGPEPIEIHEVSGSLTQCIDYVTNLRTTRSGIAVAAGQPILSALSEMDIVRISLTPDLCLDREYADVVALHASPERLEDLLRVVHEAFRPGRKAWSVILTCNALAISGAFLAGLTSLHVVVLTNVGALAAGLFYYKHVKRSDAILNCHGVRTTASPDDVFTLTDWEVVKPEVNQDVPLPEQGPKPRGSKRPTAAVSKKGSECKSPRDESVSISEISTLMTNHDQQTTPLGKMTVTQRLPT